MHVLLWPAHMTSSPSLSPLWFHFHSLHPDLGSLPIRLSPGLSVRQASWSGLTHTHSLSRWHGEATPMRRPCSVPTQALSPFVLPGPIQRPPAGSRPQAQPQWGCVWQAGTHRNSPESLPLCLQTWKDTAGQVKRPTSLLHKGKLVDYSDLFLNLPLSTGLFTENMSLTTRLSVT